MKKKYDIAILTESRYDNPKKEEITHVPWEYVENLLLEDNLVKEALEKRGFNVIRLDWNKKGFDWTSVKFALFRTTWDYFYKFDIFTKWLNEVSKKTILLNDVSIIKWNFDKHYLQDLNKNGVNIPKTIFFEKGEMTTLKEIYQNNNFEETIIKPTFSGSARHTYRINKDNLNKHENIFKELLEKEAMMIQTFQHNIIKRGEISIVLFDGKFSHSVLKRAKKGDFRVQDDFGGTVEIYHPTKKEIEYAEYVFDICKRFVKNPIIYGRVDMFYDNDEKLAIGELELIEPELFLRFSDNSADRFAERLINAVKEKN